MNKEQTQPGRAAPLVGCYPSAKLMKYTAKVSAERGLLTASCYLFPKAHNGHAERFTQKERDQGRKR